MTATRPNILFMISDDHRHSALGYRGLEAVDTPNLDRLAASGTTLSHAHIRGANSGAVCIPTRAMMMTGTSVFRTFAPITGETPKFTIPTTHRMLPEVLREHGYYTFGTGKWHNYPHTYARCFKDGGDIFFGGMSSHEEVPVHDFDPTGEYPQDRARTGDKHSSELFADQAVDFLSTYLDDAPFFLYCAFTAPHDPRTSPPPYNTKYSPDKIDMPPNSYAEHPFDNGDLYIRDEKLAALPREETEIRQHVADYYGIIEHMDAQIGRILDALERNHHADNTIIVYVADHGLAVGQHGLMGKQNLYDHSTRVPLILSGPGISQNEIIDALCYSYDLNPTLYDLLDIPAPHTVDARSFYPLLNGSRAHRDSLFGAYQIGPGKPPNFQRMVKRGDLKYIRYNVGGTITEQLFNLADDPYETNNLIADASHAGELAALRDLLVSWQDVADDPCR